MLQPPTDNLYKFMAVFGLVVIVTSVLAAFQITDSRTASELEERVLDARRASTQLAQLYKRTQLTMRLDRARRASDQEQIARLQEQLDSAAPMEDDLAESVRARGQTAWYSKRAEDIYMYSAIGILLGALFSSAGFGLWYLRVQRHLDNQLASPRQQHLPFRPRK